LHPAKRKIPLTVLLPSSLLEEASTLREKTSKLGVIGRALAIYRVDEVIIYEDRKRRSEASLILKILSYMETPQYLRKYLFSLTPELKYAGLLPPLRTPHHPDRFVKPSPGQFREGYTLSPSLVDVGLRKPLPLLRNMPPHRRITVKLVEEGGRLLAEPASKAQVPFYWGFTVKVEKKTVGTLIKKVNKRTLVIATSRRGSPISDVASSIVRAWRAAERVYIVYGPPSRGLFELFEEEGLRLEKYSDYVVNVVPHQGVERIRTEEAIHSSLAILNYLVLDPE